MGINLASKFQGYGGMQCHPYESFVSLPAICLSVVWLADSCFPSPLPFAGVVV